MISYSHPQDPLTPERTEPRPPRMPMNKRHLDPTPAYPEAARRQRAQGNRNTDLHVEDHRTGTRRRSSGSGSGTSRPRQVDAALVRQQLLVAGPTGGDQMRGPEGDDDQEHSCERHQPTRLRVRSEIGHDVSAPSPARPYPNSALNQPVRRPRRRCMPTRPSISRVAAAPPTAPTAPARGARDRREAGARGRPRAPPRRSPAPARARSSRPCERSLVQELPVRDPRGQDATQLVAGLAVPARRTTPVPCRRPLGCRCRAPCRARAGGRT